MNDELREHAGEGSCQRDNFEAFGVHLAVITMNVNLLGRGRNPTASRRRLPCMAAPGLLGRHGARAASRRRRANDGRPRRSRTCCAASAEISSRRRADHVRDEMRAKGVQISYEGVAGVLRAAGVPVTPKAAETNGPYRPHNQHPSSRLNRSVCENSLIARLGDS
jgi:hypothetical protein